MADPGDCAALAGTVSGGRCTGGRVASIQRDGELVLVGSFCTMLASHLIRDGE